MRKDEARRLLELLMAYAPLYAQDICEALPGSFPDTDWTGALLEGDWSRVGDVHVRDWLAWLGLLREEAR